jgi:hypothetical protein
MKFFKLVVSSLLLGAVGGCVLTCLFDNNSANYIDKEIYEDEVLDKIILFDLSDED